MKESFSIRGFTISSSDLARCPKQSLNASHYNVDGSCKCGKPEDEERRAVDGGRISAYSQRFAQRNEAIVELRRKFHRTYKSIGRDHGIGVERVRQIVNRAKRRAARKAGTGEYSDGYEAWEARYDRGED